MLIKNFLGKYIRLLLLEIPNFKKYLKATLYRLLAYYHNYKLNVKKLKIKKKLYMKCLCWPPENVMLYFWENIFMFVEVIFMFRVSWFKASDLLNNLQVVLKFMWIRKLHNLCSDFRAAAETAVVKICSN